MERYSDLSLTLIFLFFILCLRVELASYKWAYHSNDINRSSINYTRIIIIIKIIEIEPHTKKQEGCRHKKTKGVALIHR